MKELIFDKSNKYFFAKNNKKMIIFDAKSLI